MSRTFFSAAFFSAAFVFVVLALPGTSTTFRTSAAEPAMKAWPVGTVIFQQSDEAKKIRAALEEPTEIEFLDTPLGDVADFLEKLSGIQIEFDVEALAADGKGVDLPISKTLKNISLRSALPLLLEGQGLTYLIKNDVLLITTKTAASAPENLSTRLYQVHDLVVAANDPTAAKPDFESLIELITNTVRLHDWLDNGGTIGFIHSYHGPGILALVATHDERGHYEIEQLLKMLRESRLQQIVEAQAKQPFNLDDSNGGGMGGGSNVVPAAGIPAPTPVPAPTPAPAATPAPADAQQKSGGGFF